MIKFFKILTVAMLLFFLCGCSAKEAVAADRQEYIVSALGFDKENGKINMILEVLVVNSEDLKLEKENKVISGKADTVEGAFTDLKQKITQPLMFSHCAAVVIGKNVEQGTLKEVFDFCYKTDEINLAAMFVYSENAEKLLSQKPVSSVSVGYDIMSMTEIANKKIKNRFYEIEAVRNDSFKTFAIPVIKLSDKWFEFEGKIFFKDYKAAENIDFKVDDNE